MTSAVTVKAGTIDRLLSRGVAAVVNESHLRRRLLAGEKLRIKFGIDPTAPDLHLGHAVPLRKLREFQKLGHRAVLIIGDFTAQIGDPSGRAAARRPLSEKEVKANLKKYLAQAAKIIDVKKAEVCYNSRWYRKEGLAAILDLARSMTVSQILKRDDFKDRLASGGEVTLLEALYPLLQGYDSVKVKADAEIGGTDQTFNLLSGRRVQRHFRVKEQDILTVPLLEGTDGVKKMSKSYGNAVGLNEAPKEMFGKLMSIPDDLIGKYFTLLTDVDFDRTVPKRDAKLFLAEEVVKIYHGGKAAAKARENFVRVFRRRLPPLELKKVKLPEGGNLKEIIFKAGLAASLSQAQRLIEEGAVKVDGETKTSWREPLQLKKPALLKAGRRFVKLIP